MTYSASSNRTYIKDLTVDANGNRFEVSLAGNLLSSLTASHFVFADQNTPSNVAPVVATPCWTRTPPKAHRSATPWPTTVSPTPTRMC